MTAAVLDVRNLSVSWSRKRVLEDIDFRIPEGVLAAIVGPNGAGKSTLLKALLELVKPDSGKVLFWDKPLDSVRRRVAYMPQRAQVDWDFPVTALDVVAMGLYRKIGWFRPVRKSHREHALTCMEQVGMADFAHRQIGQLSGGQQQRIFMARAIAQDADLYFMDEPFAGVDAASEGSILTALRLFHERNKTVVCVHHNLQTVGEYFDYAVLINKTLFASGPAEESFTTERLQKTYGGRLMLS